jgi:DNA-binding transcriptional ArsR family regulator
MAGEEKRPTDREPKGKGRSGGKGKKRRRTRKPLLNHQHMYALAKEERVRMLAILCERIASPKEIAEELQEPLGKVSYHVSVLRDCRLITLDHKVPRRGAVEHFYKAVTPTLIPPGSWQHLPPAVRRGISAGIMQEFLDDASAAMEAGTFDQPPGELSWTPLILDAEGLKDFGKLARDFLESVLDLQDKASKREPKQAKTATVFLASFLSARSPKDGKKASATKRR